MENILVKILNLSITNLYGIYDYDVMFNSDVTFLYGANGCGKTTILNITAAIITGRLYELFDYEFDNIILKYYPIKNDTKINTIQIVFNNKKKLLQVIFNNDEFSIEEIHTSSNLQRIQNISSERTNSGRLYFNHYPFLKKIRDTFNYVYLPLTRSINYIEDDNFLHHRIDSRIRFQEEQAEDRIKKDIAIIQVEELVRYTYMKINFQISSISDRFRDDILKSLLDVNNQYDLGSTLDEISSNAIDVKDIQTTQLAYINILKELNLISPSEEVVYNNFFIELINRCNSFKKENLQLDFLVKYSQINKIRQLVQMAKKMEQEKAKKYKPIKIFVDTMNEFVSTNECKKSIGINTDGKIYFTTELSDKQISIQYLSSGEKQLLTFFANLIFKVKNHQSGIFVVDEPELSLHLSWQKKFMEKTMKINKNVQLIFATHSPEIVGRYRTKMYKLEKKLNQGI